ncbi:MAG: leucine-rich repeat domain-containing protein [Clostridia bacterium]|nr:leucine-rich repeat domain-containing protein [Clostridia bacterium]
MNKRKIVLMLSVFFIISFSFGLIACEKPTEGLVFEITEGGYTVVDYDGSDTNVIIPSKYNGKPIVGIGHSAFAGCLHLESISISDSVKSIASEAFDDCDNLAKVNYLTEESYFDGIQNWAQIAFADMESNPLNCGANLYINDELAKEIEILTMSTVMDYAFSGCTSLSRVHISGAVTTIGKGVFASCDNIVSVSLGPNITTIGIGAFEKCESLGSIDIPDGITSIGESAFEDCVSLGVLKIGSGVVRIGESAFNGCTNLMSVMFEIVDGWKVYESYALDNGIVILESLIADSKSAIEFLTVQYQDYIWVRE